MTRWVMLLGLLLGGLIWIVHCLLVLEFPFQLEYGEGAVLQLSVLMRQGEPVFRAIDQPPYLVCLYAPVHPWLAGLMMGPSPSLASGRLLSMLGMTLLMAGMLAYLRKRASADAAVAGVACFLLHPLVLGWGVLNRIDMLALLASALALFWGSLRPPSWRRDAGVALLLAFAFFVKQSFIAAAAALILAHLVRPAVRLALLYGACLGLGFVALYTAYGPAFFVEMFSYNALPYLRQQAADYFLHYLPSVGGLLLVAGFFAARGGLQRHRLWYLYCLTSLAVAIGSGRSGGFYNYFLELHLGLSVLAGLALREIRGAPPILVGQLLLGLFAELSFLYAPFDLLRYETRPVLEGRAPFWVVKSYETAGLQPWLDRHPGPVLAENIGNPVVLGRLPWFCDPVAYKLIAEIGKFDEDAHLLKRLAAREFALIVLQKTWGNLRFSPRAIGTILENYEPVGKAGLDTVFIPKKTPPL